jgi:hypothetical protein
MWQLACEHRCPSRSLLRSLLLGFLPRAVALAQMRLPHAFNRFRAGPVPNRRATSPRELLGLAVSKGVLALAQPARVLRWGRFAQVECGTPRMYGGAVTCTGGPLHARGRRRMSANQVAHPRPGLHSRCRICF